MMEMIGCPHNWQEKLGNVSSEGETQENLLRVHVDEPPDERMASLKTEFNMLDKVKVLLPYIPN